MTAAMKLENWTDLFKANKELLDDDYNPGQALQAKTKQKGTDGVTEVSTTTKFAQPKDNTHEVTFEGKFKTVTGDSTHEMVVKHSGEVSYDFKHNLEALTKVKGLHFKGIIKGWSGPAAKVPDLSLGAEFENSDSKSKLLVDARTFETTAQTSYLVKPNLTAAANFVFNPNDKNTPLATHDFGLNWNPSGSLFVGLKHETPKPEKPAEGSAPVVPKWFRPGKFYLYMYHAATATQTVGTEFNINWANKAVGARLGFVNKFNNESTGKLKVNHEGQLEAVLKHQINSSITASIATGINLKGVISDSKVESPAFRVGLDIKL